MAKAGKLTKLKSAAMKRWPSLSKLTRSNSAVSATEHDDVAASQQQSSEGAGLYPVYVGKSRRRYLVGSRVICHPLFRELMDRSGGGGCDGDGDVVVVSCEVVLFEHLLWMLENDAGQLGSMEELAEFYTCSSSMV